MKSTLGPGWVIGFGKQLGKQDRETPEPVKVTEEPPELVQARRSGLQKYWEDVRSGKRDRKPRGTSK